MRTNDDMKKSLLGGLDDESADQGSSSYLPQKKPTPPAYVAPTVLQEDQYFPETVFIDRLTSTKEITRNNSKEIVADELAQERIQALRNMRFKPHLEYAHNLAAERSHNENQANPEKIFHGVRFLKPLAGFPDLRSNRLQKPEYQGSES